jgi:hypothetical protein
VTRQAWTDELLWHFVTGVGRANLLWLARPPGVPWLPNEEMRGGTYRIGRQSNHSVTFSFLMQLRERSMTPVRVEAQEEWIHFHFIELDV